MRACTGGVPIDCLKLLGNDCQRPAGWLCRVLGQGCDGRGKDALQFTARLYALRIRLWLPSWEVCMSIFVFCICLMGCADVLDLICHGPHRSATHHLCDYTHSADLHGRLLPRHAIPPMPVVGSHGLKMVKPW